MTKYIMNQIIVDKNTVVSTFLIILELFDFVLHTFILLHNS